VWWLLEHPEAKSREELTDQRLEEKLGWLREFGVDLAVWQPASSLTKSLLPTPNPDWSPARAVLAIVLPSPGSWPRPDVPVVYRADD